LIFAGQVGDVGQQQQRQAFDLQAAVTGDALAASPFGCSVCLPPCTEREVRSSDLLRPSDPMMMEV
jgi:hypothetical protein